jgi:hypothetical protein
LGFAGDGQEELELGWQLVLGVQTIGEVNSSDSAIGMNLHSTHIRLINSTVYLT